MNEGGQQSVSKVSSAFCNSRPPETELRFSASFVHDAEQDAGGAKIVLRAESVYVSCAFAIAACNGRL